MADETDKQDAAEDKPAKKKGLPPLVLVAVGAALGGAGTVFMIPKPAEKQERGPPQPDIAIVEHPDVIEMNFNPRKERGYAMATASFQFAYRLDLNHQHEVETAIETNWNQMRSRVLLVLMRQTPNDLLAEDLRVLTAQLIAEMSLTLFPEGEAVVDRIIWHKILVQ